MSFLEAVWVVIVPFIPVLLPAIFFVRIHAWENILLSGSRIILWSAASSTLLLTLGLYMGIAVEHTALVVIFLSVAYAVIYRERFFTRQTAWHIMAVSIPLLFIVSAFTIPFLFHHDGLPTGDIQKAILWAQESVQTHSLPNYDRSVSLLNRDPVDFYTPGLHAISALVLALSGAPLISIGIFSIVIAVSVAWITASLAKELFDEHFHTVPPFLAALFLLTQIRFLRYLREPGYHFQNVVGELFLFGIILLCIRFLRKRNIQDAILCIVCGTALFLTHQFSAFIAVFALAGMAIGALIAWRRKVLHAIHAHQTLATVIVCMSVSGVGLLFSLGLSSKIPSLFTTTPHLIDLLLPISAYPSTMGEFWFLMGITGIILMVLDARKNNIHYKQVLVFLGATGAIGILSQGPAFGIDIPPVRALFYLAVPLSIAAAYTFGKLWYVIGATYSAPSKYIAYAACIVAIGIACIATTHKSYATLSHSVRTNSTLTAEQFGFIEQVKGKEAGGILIDDYNRKSASWFVLADIPMFTRIGADVARQMEESNQSKLRRELYLKQLDYEKIVELGSLPEIVSLLEKNKLQYVTGVQGSSYAAFSHNPLLQEVARVGDVAVFKPKSVRPPCVGSECRFLLRASTLANDIGDEMDIFENLQASIRSARISDPQASTAGTYREVSSPVIPLTFNVGDYTRVLWDPQNTSNMQSSFTFMLWLTSPVQGLSLQTSSGQTILLPFQKHIAVELRSDMVHSNDKGFVEFALINPRGERVPIDLIALGPSLVP